MMHTICKYADETELVISDIIKKENGEEANFVDIITDSHLQTIKDMNLQNRGLTNMKQYK